MASERDFAFDELGNSMENNYETDNNDALGTLLMDNYVWQDDDISKSIEVLGTSLIDKLGSLLQEDQSKSHDASYTSVTEEHITFQEDNMTKKDNVDAFGSSITSTKPTDSNRCFLNIHMENPSFTERAKGFDPSSLLKTHVQGVLNHGRKTFYTYVDLNEYCYDSYLIMNVLLRSMHDSTGNISLWLTIKIEEENTISGDNDSMCRLYVEKRSMEDQNRIYMKLKQPTNERMTQISALHGIDTRNNGMRCY